VIDDLLVLDNDVSVFDLVEEGRSGDMARLQQFARTLVQKNSSKEELADFIERWNAQVRHYEKAEDRLKRFALGGIGIGTAAAALTIEEVRQFVPFVAPLVPYIYAKLTDDDIPEGQAAGRVMDRLLAMLSAVPPEAVLLSRMRKQISSMKSPSSRLRQSE
jgi:hypothetical protein